MEHRQSAAMYMIYKESTSSSSVRKELKDFAMKQHQRLTWSGRDVVFFRLEAVQDGHQPRPNTEEQGHQLTAHPGEMG